MARIAGLLILLGFGSVALHEFTDYQFRLLSWMEDYQPWAGVGVGVVGVLLAVVRTVAMSQSKSDVGGGPAA